MAAVELDPLFAKALKLFQSRAKDSTLKLEAMLDDAIAQRKGLKPTVKVPQTGDHVDKTVLMKGKTDDDVKKKDGEKRSADKSGKDPLEPEVKRSKQKDKELKEKDKERERQKKDKERKDREEAQRQKDKSEKEKKEKELATRQEAEIISDEEEPAQQMDAGDFARDLGIACVVCRQFDVSSGNQLVECQECHSLYHQECHKPPVTGQDVRDPRFVWYCSRCTKSFKKMMTQKPTKSTKPVAPLSHMTAKESTSASTKVSKSEADSGSQAFRRMDPKAIVPTKDASSLSSSSKGMVGLAGLAANLTKPRGESKSAAVSKKHEHRGDGSKTSSGKSEMKASGIKQDSGSKASTASSSSSSKTDAPRKAEGVRPSGREDHKEGKKTETKIKPEDKKSSDSFSTVKKEEKKEKGESGASKSSKEDKKSDALKSSPSHSGCVSSSSSPPAAAVMSSTSNADAKNSSSSSSNSNSSNKQAVANLSMVTANKRIQMMKKKAQSQTKPQEKKVHYK